jgi:ATP phosphoribosyltransferase regulatory subunit
LSELRGYHYLTGLVFGAFAPGAGTAIANGGRYDHVGEAFGRPRPASGFAVNLSALRVLLDEIVEVESGAIFVPYSENAELWFEVQRLRNNGERVICGLQEQDAPLEHQACSRILVETANGFAVENL